MERHLTIKKYKRSTIYGDGNTAKRMLDIVKTIKPDIQKQFIES